MKAVMEYVWYPLEIVAYIFSEAEEEDTLACKVCKGEGENCPACWGIR
jgi:hypothetical protein